MRQGDGTVPHPVCVQLRILPGCGAFTRSAGCGPQPHLALPSSFTVNSRSFMAQTASRLAHTLSPACPEPAHQLASEISALLHSAGQESSTVAQKSFELTGFQNTLSGLYSPVVFSASGANLTDVHLFCLLACDQDSCCDGFVLSQVKGGPIFCGLLSSPDVLLCNVDDWTASSEVQANATCPGVTYDQESHQVTFHLGGQEFMKTPRGTPSCSLSLPSCSVYPPARNPEAMHAPSPALCCEMGALGLEGQRRHPAVLQRGGGGGGEGGGQQLFLVAPGPVLTVGRSPQGHVCAHMMF
ncbi:hypothetical protein GHT09_007454 [Marmota monax]|uniref:Uncharacterized protein n=1 Tax=Marmota monax TaxID=9995 RepID=A0A834QPT8_MARMO|nr:hypothetical protein GHT09_007454 [Marmota monax]